MHSFSRPHSYIHATLLLLTLFLVSLKADPPSPPSIPLALVQIHPDTGVSDSDGITHSPQITVNGVALPGAAVDLRVDGISTGTWIAGPDGSWSATLSATPLSHGQHSLTAVIGAGVGYRSSTYIIRVDTVAPSNPSFTSLSPDTGSNPTDWITSATTLTLTGRSDPNSTVLLTLDSVPLPRIPASPEGTWTYTIENLTPGAHTLTARSTDLAGNDSNPVSRTFTVDTTPPPAPTYLSLTNDTGPRNDDGITSDTTPTLTGAAEPQSRVRLLSNGQPIATAIANTSGFWRTTLAPLPNGVHQWTPVAEDAAGNSTPGAPFRIEIKSSAFSPSLEFSDDTGLPGDGITTDRTLVFSGFADGQLTVTLDGQSLGSPPVSSNGRWTLDHSAHPLNNGVHTVVLATTDRAGNKASSTHSFRVEFIALPPPPNFQVTWANALIPPNGVVRPPGPLIVRGKSYTQAPRVEIHLNGTLRFTATPDTFGAWIADLGDLAAGDYSLKIRGADGNGNTSDFSNPVAFIVAPPLGDPVTIHFDAVITQIQDPNAILNFNTQSPNLLPIPEWTAMRVGSHLSGSYSYRLGSHDLDPAPSRGNFQFSIPDAKFDISTLAIRNRHTSPSLDFVLEDGAGPRGGDRYQIRAAAEFVVPTVIPIDSIELVLEDLTGAQLTETQLSEFPPAPAAWPSKKLIIRGPTDPVLGELWSIQADLVSLENRDLYVSEPPQIFSVRSQTTGLTTPFNQIEPLIVDGYATPNTSVRLSFASRFHGISWRDTVSDNDGFWSVANVFLSPDEYLVTGVTLSPWGSPSDPSPPLFFQILQDNVAPPTPSAPQILPNNPPPDGRILEFMPVTLQGLAEPNSYVLIYLNGSGFGEVLTDPSGVYTFTNFSFQSAGEYEITVQARDDNWNMSPFSDPTHVTIHWPDGPTVTLHIEAEITTVFDPENAGVGAFAPGQRITGSFTYRLGAASFESAPWIGNYQSTAPGGGFTLSLGGRQFVPGGASSSIIVGNDIPLQHGGPGAPPSGLPDSLFMNTYLLVESPSSTWEASATWQLEDLSGLALESTALPEIAPTLSQWTRNQLFIHLAQKFLDPRNSSAKLDILARVVQVTHEITPP